MKEILLAAKNWLMEKSGFQQDTEKGEVEMADVKRNDKDTTQTHSYQPDLCRGMYASKDRKKMELTIWDHLRTDSVIWIIVVLLVCIFVKVCYECYTVPINPTETSKGDN
ncbi:hypothetical protein J6590_081257 [Homalodisca vitripennis]|nr:hypothetical protein J6590_081257 [Homalodisca vitripennis]